MLRADKEKYFDTKALKDKYKNIHCLQLKLAHS